MKMSSSRVKRLATLAVLVSVGMVLSYVEAILPIPVAVPGVKLGLANISTLFALYALGSPAALLVSLLRVSLSALLFGNTVGFLYSLSGALMSLAFMMIFKRLPIFSPVGVSIVGGVMHNAGQIIAAAFIMRTAAIAAYLPPLIISGTLAGILVGFASGLLLARVGKYIK